MHGKFRVILNRIKLDIIKKRRKKLIDPFVELNDDSYYGNSFRIDLRNPKEGNVYLKVGKHCVL